MKKLAIITLGMLLLSACNGNRDPVTTQAATPATDAFTAQVQAQAATAPEDTEPQDISAVALKTPEDAEPVAVN